MGRHLPGVAWGSQGLGGHVDLGGGGAVAGVAHVGGAAHSAADLLIGHNDIAQDGALFDALNQLGDVGITGFDGVQLIGRQALPNGGGQLFVLFVKDGSAHFLQSLLHDFGQGDIGDIVAQTFVNLNLQLGARHQSGAPGHVADALVNLHHLGDLGGADEIMDGGMVLDHVGRFAAHVHIGVMNPSFGDDVFPQVIDAHAHQLAGIQSGAAQVRSGGGVSCAALEAEKDA